MKRQRKYDGVYIVSWDLLPACTGGYGFRPRQEKILYFGIAISISQREARFFLQHDRVTQKSN